MIVVTVYLIGEVEMLRSVDHLYDHMTNVQLLCMHVVYRKKHQVFNYKDL